MCPKVVPHRLNIKVDCDTGLLVIGHSGRIVNVHLLVAVPAYFFADFDIIQSEHVVIIIQASILMIQEFVVQIVLSLLQRLHARLEISA